MTGSESPQHARAFRPTRASLSAAQALALRRALVMAAAIAATLAAHGVSHGGLSIIPAAPALWASLVCISILCGPRAARFAPRGPLRSFGELIAAQALLHVGLTFAPWAFGVSVHHQVSFLTPLGLVTHLTAALALALLVARAESVLAGCLRVVQLVHRLFGEPSSPLRRTWAKRVVLAAYVATHRPHIAANPVRGPPPNA